MKVSPAFLTERGIFEQFHAATLKDYLGPEIITNVIREYNRNMSADWDKGLYLHSEMHNTGKSLLANIVAKATLAKGLEARIVDSEQITQEYKNTMFAENESNWEEMIIEPHLLVIDKLETTMISELVRGAVGRALELRFRRARATVIASTLHLYNGPNSVSAKFGEDIAALIDKTCIPVECPPVAAWERQKQSTLKKISFGDKE